jgi:endonuclease-3
MAENLSYDEQYRKRLERIMELLKQEYGVPEQPDRGDPVDSLITTILSQNTNDRNRDVAKRRLDERFSSFREILEADVEEVEEAVRPAGLGPTKAERIQTFLSMIEEERGEFSLDHVRRMDREEAKSYLTEFPGVGPKTAAVTLCFAFGMPVMPVDTHVHRLARRFELIPDSMGREKAHEVLEREVPDERIYEVHINMIKHGREVCTARSPSCEESPLYEYCVNCECRH